MSNFRSYLPQWLIVALSIIAVAYFAGGAYIAQPGTGGSGSSQTNFVNMLSEVLQAGRNATYQGITQMGDISGVDSITSHDGSIIGFDNWIFPGAVTMSGTLTISNGAPGSLEAVNRQYVDGLFLGGSPTNVVWLLNGSTNGATMALNVVLRGALSAVMSNVGNVTTLYLSNTTASSTSSWPTNISYRIADGVSTTQPAVVTILTNSSGGGICFLPPSDLSTSSNKTFVIFNNTSGTVPVAVAGSNSDRLYYFGLSQSLANTSPDERYSLLPTNNVTLFCIGGGTWLMLSGKQP